MIDRFRTAVIALCVAPLALPMSACGGRVEHEDGTGADAGRNRIVCTSSGKVVYDDFAKRDTGLAEGGISYVSLTTGKRSRVTGECYAYLSGIPAGWKATFPIPAVPLADVPATNPGDDQ